MDENFSKDNGKIKSGYLQEDFLLFHLKDRMIKEFDFHYHEFNKIIIFLSGKVTYLIEGKAYYLRPWDILLVNNHDLHKPIIDSSEVYERIIIWLNLKFIEDHDYEHCNLLTCFNLVNEKRINLIRLSEEAQSQLKSILWSLEDSINSKNFGSKLLSNVLFLQLLIYINRIYIGDHYIKDTKALKYDPQIDLLLKYINENLNKDLSIDNLAEKFYLSRYYLMHKFKKETGYTIHNYIIQKKILLSIERLKEGIEINKVIEECGFADYSSFLRAFKKIFNKSPGEFMKYHNKCSAIEKE